ncbi:hypothetical protein SLEP1_g51913 [Rubroshorea leprosula]|uniref:Uncharacterized protein n=1 Tax=Rubroshorea leprosula TaxID=152421 RepID=A0AAV5M4N1_9ROSI|nr:hypothetical protein SLEP1_g51913 [Rubroshorea leprosula]
MSAVRVKSPTPRSSTTSTHIEFKAINSATMVESVMQVCFLDPQETAPPPSMKIHPVVDL